MMSSHAHSIRAESFQSVVDAAASIGRLRTNDLNQACRLDPHRFRAGDMLLHKIPDRWPVHALIGASPARDGVFLARLDGLARPEQEHLGNTLPHGLGRIDGVADAPTADHVSAL